MTPNHYRAFCNDEPTLPLFMQPYWLDVTAGRGKWTGILAYDKEEAVQGAWAIYRTRQRGMRALVLPPLTQFTGIWIRPGEGLTEQKVLERNHRIVDELENQLPDARIIELKLQHTLLDWLPFYWKGYSQETRYTFRIARGEADKAREALTYSSRRNLRSAGRKFEIQQSNDVAGLYEMVSAVFRIRNSRVPISQEMLTSLYQTLHGREQCAIYVASDDSGPGAMIFVAWDNLTTYYLLGGRTGSNTRNATNLLLWQAIDDAMQRGHDFDFEGSMIKGVHAFFRTFGATMHPYHFIYKYQGIARLKQLF